MQYASRKSLQDADSMTVMKALENENDVINDSFPITLEKLSGSLVMAAVTAWTMMPSAALAAGPDWGIFEGRTGSLLHPIMMGSLLVFSVLTALLGFQYRRQRTIGDEIKSVQAELSAILKGADSVAAAMAEAKEAEDTSRLAALEGAKPLEAQLNDLKAERKDLATKGPRDKHYGQGALLAFLGTAFAIEGPLNTYARAGKLFPGPHLYAGAGLVVCWALASACVPNMIKGNDTARSVHIGANVVGLGLFAWQVVSGIPILLKVIENTKWP